MTRMRYFIDAVALGCVYRIRPSQGWAAACGGRLGPSGGARSRVGAWAWVIREAWGISAEDVRLARQLTAEGRYPFDRGRAAVRSFRDPELKAARRQT